MASRFEGFEDKAGADVYLFATPGSKIEGTEGEAIATISEAIARVRFRRQSGASAGGIIFVEGLGFVEEDEFDELLSMIRRIPVSSVESKERVALGPDSLSAGRDAARPDGGSGE